MVPMSRGHQKLWFVGSSCLYGLIGPYFGGSPTCVFGSIPPIGLTIIWSGKMAVYVLSTLDPAKAWGTLNVATLGSSAPAS